MDRKEMESRVRKSIEVPTSGPVQGQTCLVRMSLDGGRKLILTQPDLVVVAKFSQDGPGCLQTPFFNKKCMKKEETCQCKTLFIDTFL